ncbi:MAG: hypothetical protein ACYC54_07775 [Sedimentisphaerales bacterium]
MANSCNSSSSWLIKKQTKKSSSDGFLKVKPDCKLRVRLIDNPVKVVRIFSNNGKCAFLNNEEVGRRLKEKYTKELSDVSVRYDCWCIDRDDKSMKILDMPPSIARSLGSREALLGKHIAGEVEGCDWSIITNGKKGKDVRYEAVYIEETPLSCSDKQTVEDKKSEQGCHYDLRNIFKSCSFEEAENKLFL